ncbi:DUF2764 family protein [Candidatus Nitrospira salsa]
MRIWQRRYYTLYASLPALPHFHKAKVLPISRERLDARLRMLAEEDSNVVEQTWSYFDYERQPMNRTDSEMVTFYTRFMNEVTQPTLRTIIEFDMIQRTIVAALRRRTRGRTAPRKSRVWGGGPYVRQIERHWNKADFNLTSVFPWIPEIRGFLESNEPLALEQKLKNLTWGFLDRLCEGHYFTFDAVLIYLVKWGMLNQWLLHSEEAAITRFQSLVEEMMIEHEHLFGGKQVYGKA